MTRCLLCKEYPEGTSCALTGCPGRAFRLSPVPYRPDSFEDWLQSINDQLFREVAASENLNHSEHESYHNGNK